MKMRDGFVSNSSSSSFIIPFDKKPESIHEMKEILFGDKEYYYDPYYDPDSTYFSERTAKYPAMQVAETVFKDIEYQKPLSEEQLVEELSRGYISSTLQDGTTEPSMEDFRDSDNDINWEAYDNAFREYTKKLAKEIIAEAENKELYVVNYSDDDCYGCALEHGPLFDKIGSFRISKH